MNPELERLIQAYDAITLATNEEAPAAWASFEALLESVLTRNPKLQRESLIRAIQHAHRQWQRAHSKPSTLPPST